MMGIALFDEHMAIEAAHFRDGEDADAAEGLGGHRQDLALGDVGPQLPVAGALEAEEGDVAIGNVALQSAAGEVRGAAVFQQAVLDQLILHAALLELAQGGVAAMEAHEGVRELVLAGRGNAFLIDFGISKNYGADGRATSSMPVGISEGYAPIEQYSQLVGDFSPESDVYSLGATLYYLVTGKVPPASVVRASGQDLQFPISVSSYMRGLVSSTMSVSRNSRPANVDMFLQPNNPNMVHNEDPATLIIEKPRIKMEDNNNGDLLVDNGEGKKSKGNVKVVVMSLSLLFVAGLVVALFFSNSPKPAEPVDTSLDSTAVEVVDSAADLPREDKGYSDNNSSYSNENGLHLYQGKIGNLSITMFLNPNADENEVAGYYKYNNSQINTKFELVVVRRYQNRLILNEYRPDGFNCGTYDGYIEDGGISYSGSFVNSEGKEFSFSVYRE